MSSILQAIVVILSLLIAGCWDQSTAPSAAPTNLTVTPGENRVVLNWDAQPGLTYWIFYKAGSSVTTNDPDMSFATGIAPPYIPYVISGLVNGTQYAFIVNAHNNNSKGGPPTAVVTATPRLLGPGIPWTVGTPLSSHDLKGIAFGNNYYVAVGDGATVFTASYNYTDTGGVTAWNQVTQHPAGTSVNLSSVVYDGTRFVALGSDGSVIRSRSNADLVDWDPAVAIGGTAAMHAIAYGAGIYVAVGTGGTIERNTADGVTGAWSAQTSGTSEDLYGVSYVNGIFIATGTNGALLTSPDGITWTARASNTNSTLRHVAYGANTSVAGAYVAVGDAGTIVSSADAVTWTAQQTLPTTQSFYSICFGPDTQFIAVGTNGTVAYSLTGADGSWSTANAGSIDLYDIAPSGVFIAVGAAGTNVSGK